MDKLIKAISGFIPFIALYPGWVKFIVALWILLTAIIVISLIFVPKEDLSKTTKKEISLRNTLSQAPKKEIVKTKTLHDLFLSDFDKTQMLGTYHLKSEEKVVYTVEFIIWCDFDTKSKFLSIFLPKSDYTFKASKFLIDRYDDILNGNIRSLMQGMIHQAPGEKAESFDELKFSGRIYIYHETYLLPDRIDSLVQEYKNKSLSPQFRGRDYLIMRNSPLYEK